MKKYNYVGWCMAGSLGLSAMSGQAAQPEKKQPHIILIMTDQKRWEELGLRGMERGIFQMWIAWQPMGICFVMPIRLLQAVLRHVRVC